MADIDGTVIKQKAADFLGVPVARLRDSDELSGIVPDSFMLVELLIELQEEYGIRLVQEDLTNVKTVGELTGLILSRTKVSA